MASAGSEASWPGDDDGTNNTSATGRNARLASISCEMCQSRKVRCDRQRPSCGWCFRNGQACIYKTRKKPGLRAGFGKELEGRLDRLEELFHAQQDTITQLTQQSRVGEAVSGGFNFNESPVRQQNTTASLATPANNSHGASPAVAQNEPTPHASSTTTSWSNAVNTVGSYALPPFDLLYGLTKLFFDRIYPWFPLLHEPSTMNLLSPTATLGQGDIILLHAIVVVTLRYCADDRLERGFREHYYNVSKQKVLLHALEVSNVESLQALTLVALDVVGTSNGPPALNLLAMAAKNVEQLGLASEATPASTSPLVPSISTLQVDILAASDSFVEEECRRRLFWAVYLLDRLATVATAFDFSLDESKIHRRLPCHHDFFFCNHSVITDWVHPATDTEESFFTLPPEYLGPFGYYIRLVGVLSRIHLFLRRPINIGSRTDVAQWQHEYRQLDDVLKSWRTNLPNEYQSGAGSVSSNSQMIMMYMTFHMTTIRLHSSAAYPTNQSQFFVPSSSASQQCLGAVRNIVALCELARNHSVLDRLGPQAAFCVWVAARLLLVHGATIERQVEPSIMTLVETIDMLGHYWNIARRYADVLRRVLDEFHEATSPDIAHDADTAAPSVQILADMRRCAYDLDLLISRQPRWQSQSIPITTIGAASHAESSLEYLDLFDFFNVPRLPTSNNEPFDASIGTADAAASRSAEHGWTRNTLHNTNVLFDPNADWLSDASIVP